MSDDLWQFFLSLPVIFYSSWIFFRGAFYALKAKTLDMMVLVAVAIGTGWIYSVAATFWIEGDVFYEAAAFLAAFVLLGHWFEMRARGGANDAIRALLDLAPPKAIVIRDGEELRASDSRSPGRRPVAYPAGRQGARRRGGDRRRELGRRVDGHRGVAPDLKKPGDTLVGATINKQGTPARARPLSARKRRSRKSSSSSRRRRTRKRQHSAWRIGRPSGSCWSPDRRPRHFHRLVRRRRRPGARRAAVRDHRRCHHVPGRARPRDADRDHGRDRPGREAGILFKNAIAIEQSADLETVVLDKTGTLTQGEPEVVEIQADGVDEAELLRLVAAVERANTPWQKRSSRKPRHAGWSDCAPPSSCRSRTWRPGDRRRSSRCSRQPGPTRARTDLAQRARHSSRGDRRRRADGRPRRRRWRTSRVDRDRRRPSRVGRSGDRSAERAWRSTGHAHGRQPADGRADRIARGSTRSWPKSCRAKKRPRLRSCRRRGGRSRWLATASTMRRRSLRPRSASRSEPAPMSQSKLPTSS